jgi:prophage regulatory protein
MTLGADIPSHTPRDRRHDASLYGVGPDDRLIRLNEVMHLVGYGRTTIYTKIKLGTFPKPVKPSAGDTSRWVLGEIRKFNASAVAARDQDRERSAAPGRTRCATLTA